MKPMPPTDDRSFLVTGVAAATLSDEGSAVSVDFALLEEHPSTVRLVFPVETLTMLLDHLQMLRIQASQQARTGMRPPPVQ